MRAFLHEAAVLAVLEGAYVRTFCTGAQLYAYGALFAGGTAEHDFLERFLREKAAPITAQLGLVVEWIAHVVLPTLARGLGGRWALLVGHGAVCGTTAYLVRYSNKYFLALEMSDVFITFGWMALGVTFVGMEALRGHPRGQRAKDK